jgi:protein O-mannosyl-transferase
MSRKTQEQNYKFVPNSSNLSFWQKIIPPSILAIITTLFYWPSLKYPFQFDDLANITKKFAIRSDNPLTRWTNHSRWMGDWLNKINYEIGMFDPFSYRLLNLFIHVLAGILVFYLIIDLCRFLKNKPFFYNNAVLIAFATSTLFLIHPVQTQTVSYVIQARLEGLATLFILATILTFVRAFHVKNMISKISLFSLSLLFAFISCGTKEIVVVTPFLILLVDWFFISQEKWENFKKRGIWYITFLAVFLVAFFSYISFDFLKRVISFSMTTGNNRGNILTHHAYDVITPLHFLISEFKVLLHYLVMFLWPFNISVEYDWKLSESFFAVDSFFPFLILAAIISFAVYTIIKKKNSFIAFGLFWFFLAMAPRTTIIPSPELICDYKTYLASVGWLFVLAVGIIHLFKFAIENFKNIPKLFHAHNYQIAALAILTIPLGIGTIVRNTVWSSSSAFWADIVVKAPLKARGHNNLGVALSEEGKIDESIDHYKKAIQLDKHYADPLSNIAVAYSLKGEIDQAIAALKGAINIFPNYPEAYNNLGTLLLKKKNYEDAEKSLNMAIKLRPYYGKAFYNLGRLYMERENEEKAWEYFKKATEGDLDNPEGFFTLGQMSIRLKKYEEAANAFEQILRRGISNPQVQFNLGNAYFMTGNLEKAQNVYHRLVEDNPLDSRYLYNLAETLYSKNNFADALTLFKKVTTLPQPLAQAHFRIASCLEKLEQVGDAKSYLNELISANAPDEFKQTAKNELARLDLQEKVKEGKGSIRMSELQKILKQTASENTAETQEA